MYKAENDLLNYKSMYTNQAGVLNNRLGINDAKILDEVERQWTTYRLAQLYLQPEEQSFDVKHYLSIHKYLFDRIYPFAGQTRSETIAKRITFCLPQYIYPSLVTFLKDAKQRSDAIYDRNSLLKFIVYLHTELDVIHAFREGNGRTNREFIRQYVNDVCRRKNLEPYFLDYSLIKDKEQYIDAVVSADLGRVEDLMILFDSILTVKGIDKDVRKKM